MKYNKLGNTDIKISHYSLGGAGFSDIYGTFDEAQSIHFIRDCLFRGINYIETSHWYGQGTSEKTIGKAIQGVHREIYYLGSKVGRYEKDIRNMFDFSAERSYAAIESSLQHLGVSYVDLIQVHDISFGDIDVILRETLPACQKIVESGKARYIGISDYDIDLLKAVLEETEVPIAAVLSYGKSTLLDNRLQNYVEYFKSRGVGVINASATGMGLLTNNGPMPWHPASDELKTMCYVMGQVCRQKRVDLARIATWFSLVQPGLDTTVCGFSTLDQLKDTARLMDEGLTFEEEAVLQDLKTRFIRNEIHHWDNVELLRYKAKLAEMGDSSGSSQQRK